MAKMFKQRKKTNSYERMFDALMKTPLTVEQMEAIVGKGYAIRASEFNRAFGDQFYIHRKHNVFSIERKCRIKINRKNLAA